MVKIRNFWSSWGRFFLFSAVSTASSYDEYQHCPRLNNCVKDTQDFAAVLLEKYQFEPENILTLYNAESARATLGKLEEEAAWRKAEAANTILSYYDYNRRYPSGKYRDQALQAIKRLEEEKAWQRAVRAHTLSAFLEYKDRYPQGRYVEKAEEHIQAILASEQEPAAWQEALASNTEEGYHRFLKTYPKSPFAASAQEGLNKLQRAKVAAEEERRRRMQEQANLQTQQNKKLQRPGSEAPLEILWRKRLPIGIGLGVLLGMLLIWGLSKRNDVSPIGQDTEQAGQDTANYGSVRLSGHAYRTIRLNGLTWMAENLNYEIQDSWCYDNKSANCDQYGRLYTWDAAKKACAAVGWRLPSDQEWREMTRAPGTKFLTNSLGSFSPMLRCSFLP